MIFSYLIVLIPKAFTRIFLSTATGFKTGKFARRPVYLAASFSANFLFYLIRGKKKLIFFLSFVKIYVVSIIIFIVAIIICYLLLLLLFVVFFIITLLANYCQPHNKTKNKLN